MAIYNLTNYTQNANIAGIAQQLNTHSEGVFGASFLLAFFIIAFVVSSRRADFPTAASVSLWTTSILGWGGWIIGFVNELHFYSLLVLTVLATVFMWFSKE